MVEKLTEHMNSLTNCFSSPNESDSNGETANVVDGLFAISRSLREVAKSIDRLGTNDATTKMGAIELLAMEVKNLKHD